MQRLSRIGALGLQFIVCLLPMSAAGAASPTSGRGNAPVAELLPARKLRCTLGHALNLDPSKNQTIADIHYEGSYDFSLFLPAIPRHQGPPPDPSADPKPVNPATKIVKDPAGLASDAKPAFRRVIDLWPHRVELTSMIDEQLSRLIIVSDIDVAEGTANLFMTRAVDAGSIDLGSVYQGGCRFDLGSADGRSSRS